MSYVLICQYYAAGRAQGRDGIPWPISRSSRPGFDTILEITGQIFFLGHILYLYLHLYFGKFCRGNVFDRTRVNPEKRNLSSPNQEREIIISMPPPIDQYKYLK